MTLSEVSADETRSSVDFTSINDVPEAYAWEAHGDSFADALSKDGNLPVVDFSAPKLDVMNQISSACQVWGAFQLVNHGIPRRIFEQIEDEARRFFALPMDEKLKAKRTPDSLSGYGQARISHFFDKLMWYEGFTVHESPHQHVGRLMAPEDCDRFCDVMEEYQREIHHLANDIMELMLSSLGLSKDDIEWLNEEKGNATDQLLNINYYPKCPQPEAVMGLAAHTDSSVMTILYQSNTSGLQTMKDGEWVTIPPMPDAVIVNIGDLLHILSNGRFKSVLHRATVNQHRHRYSFAYFWGPQSAVAVGPHPKLLSPIDPPLYPSLSWQEYLKIKAKHFNKTLEFIAIENPASLTRR